MSTHASLIGQTLDERYRLEAKIGEGGQAVVCTGTDTDSGILRAIKLLPASFNTPPQVIERFKKESLLLANLPKHEYVVQVYDGGYDANMRAFYMVIDFVNGVTLSEFITARADADVARDVARDVTSVHQAGEDDDATGIHSLEPERVCTPSMAVAITRRVALGLHHAHRNRFVHRDVKPSNVLIGRNGDVKLTDFGIARVVEESGLTGTGTAIGTLQYMSPEQIKGRDLDHRTDIYSLGIVLYECLVGRTPFAAAGRELVPYHILNTPPVPPSERNSEVIPELEAIVLRALAKSADERYQTMAELEAALAGLVHSGLLPDVAPRQIADAVAQVAGEHDRDVIQVGSPNELDSNERCGVCGAPLPLGWRQTGNPCPACGAPLTEVAPPPNEWIRQLISRAREKKNIRGKVGFELARYIYSEELQDPPFQEWKTRTAGTEAELQKGTVAIPAPVLEQTNESDLPAAARRLMEIADYLTDPEFNEYNHRLSERYEVEALAAHARAKGYQLLGRHHTRRGSSLTEPQAATAVYENARNNFIQAAEQYRLASDAWRRYESGEPNERIQNYYAAARDEVRQRRVWSAAADLLTQGILRFPHNQTEAYAHFRGAAALRPELPDQPGIALDLKLTELYDNYYDKTLDQLQEHQTAITAAQTSARAAIAAAQTTDAALLENDRRLAADWLRGRARIAHDYFKRRENLPHALRRIRLIAWAVGYLLAFILAVAFIGEARHAAYSTANPGPFWPGWPMLLAQARGYAADFGRWHHFLVMLIGIDLLIFWPFNLLVARQTPRAQRPARTRPVIPALSRLLMPLVDGLDGLVRRGVAGGDPPPERPVNKLVHTTARLIFAVAPWLPWLLLAWGLPGSFFGLPNNYLLWMIALLIAPALAGRWVGQAMRRLSEKLDQLEHDEHEAREALDQKVLIDRDNVRHERRKQATIVHDEFAHANAEHATHRATIVGMLEVFLARLLHYHKEEEYVKLPDIDRTLIQWREEIDQTFLRHMGQQYAEAQTSPVAEAEWRVERPLETLRVTTLSRAIPLRIVYDQDGYVLWGIDGYQECRRQRLQSEADGYCLNVKLPSDTKQVNFTRETLDRRWPDATHTVWIEGNRPG